MLKTLTPGGTKTGARAQSPHTNITAGPISGGQANIRQLSRQLGLPTAELPSQACLASRFPYGSPITAEKLEQVGRAEAALRALGFATVRVRHYGDLARLELPTDDFGRILEDDTRLQVVAAVKEAGFTYITADLQGFRSGSMNEVL